MDTLKDYRSRAIARLRQAVAAGPDGDMRTAQVYAALDYLAKVLPTTWPVTQFRQALEMNEPTSRWQNANASLNGIERILSGNVNF